MDSNKDGKLLKEEFLSIGALVLTQLLTQFEAVPVVPA